MLEEKRNKILVILFFVLSIGFLLVYTYFRLLIPRISYIDIAKNVNEDLTVSVTSYIDYWGVKDIYCAISTTEKTTGLVFKKVENNTCILDVNEGLYYIFLKKENKIITYKTVNVEINAVTNIKVDKENIYLAVNGATSIKVSVEKIGNVTEILDYKILDTSIATYENNRIVAKSLGQTTLTVTEITSKISKKINILVTDLINTPKIRNSRKVLSCKEYTKDQAILFDEILATRISNAGYKTRAGVVAAARFLTLEFPRKISYFFENGRLNNHSGANYVDGEGRYYHVGLYLDTSKFSSIKASYAGPAIWGCPLTNYEDSGKYVPGYKYPNGLDCSGFVSWALLNGGFDVGDSGAGDYAYRDDDLPDNGEKVDLTVSLLQSGKVKVGDLIGSNLHAAIIVGLEDNKIYIAESLEKGVVIETFTFEKCVQNKWYDFIVLMDKLYQEDGNLTDMW